MTLRPEVQPSHSEHQSPKESIARRNKARPSVHNTLVSTTLRIMRPTSAPLQWQCLLCVFASVCSPATAAAGDSAAAAALPPAVPWRVPCPVRCTCQIKPWFSPDSVYQEAPTVDCNDLLLTQLPAPVPSDTHTLRLQSNLLWQLDARALRRLPNLTDLDLSQNRFGGVRAVTRRSWLPSLRSLHLEENRIVLLPDSSFSWLPALQELFLSHNNLRSIAPGAFSGLGSLLRLHINNNRLAAIDRRWFAALPRLEVLMLGGNPVEALPDRGFAALKSLRSLVLGGMGLRGLAEEALEGLDGLESLSFYDNRLTEVPTRALRRVPGLKFLDLNKNRIKLIETGDFRDMVHLKELGLNNMEELVSVERAALDNLPELTKLEITNNPRLSFVHPRAFLRLDRLESLMLNSNSLSALHRHVMVSLPNLQEVSLHSNPLRCDCLFRWAAEEASRPRPPKASPAEGESSRTVRFIQPQATLCAEPPELRARRVREVSSGEMSSICLPVIPVSALPSYVGVKEGGKLVLHCRGLADPQPQMYWVIPSGLRLGPAPHNATNVTRAAAPRPGPSSSGRAENEEPRDPSGHYRLLPEGTLEVSEVTPGQAGLYTCIAENALGADTRSVTVGVRSRKKKRKGGGAAPLTGEDAGLKVREVGRFYAILSWQSGHNLPSTRLSWQALHSHAPTYSTRILAGTQSFNLTHLQAQTLYRVCLHLGTARDAERVGRGRLPRRPRPRCVSFQTQDAPEPRPVLRPDPELTSTAVTLLLLLLLVLLLLAAQSRDAKDAAPAVYDVQEVKSAPKQKDKVLVGEDC